MGLHELGSRAIIGQFYNRLNAYMGESWINNVSMLFQSDQESETYKWLGMPPAMRQWVGGKDAKGFRANGISITNKEWESTVEIPRKWLRRDKTGQITVRVSELAQRAAEHWQKLLTLLIANGTGSTYGLCYDGNEFFDASHSEGSSGTQVNLITSSHVAALDVATATAPTPIEAANAIIGVIGYMLTYKDDQGEPMNWNAKNFVVMTSPALWVHLAKSQAALINSGDTSPLNAVAAQAGFNIQIVPNPGLTFTTQFVTIRTDAPARALIRQEEVPTQMKALGEGSDHTFMTANLLFSAEATRNVGYGYWQYASHATLS